MNRTAQQQPQGIAKNEGVELTFAVNAPLSTGELWGLARRQILNWLTAWAILFLSIYAAQHFYFSETFRNRESLAALALMAACVGLTPINKGWVREKLRALSLSTPQIRMVRAMVTVPLVLIMHVCSWVFALTIIGIDHFNAIFFLLIVAVFHVAALIDVLCFSTPERSEVVAGNTGEGEKQAEKQGGQRDISVSLTGEFIDIPWKDLATKIALLVGLPLGVCMLVWVVTGILGPKTLAAAGVIYVAMITTALSAFIEQKFMTWLTFGGSRDVWFRENARRIAGGALAATLLGYVVTGALLLLGIRLGREPGFDLAVGAPEFWMIWVATAVAISGLVILTIAIGAPLNNRGDGWGSFFSYLVLLCFVVLVATGAHIMMVEHLEGNSIWGETVAVQAAMHVVIGFVLGIAGLAILKWASKRMDIAHAEQASTFGFKNP